MATDREIQSAKAAGRSSIYGLLATIFREAPTEALIGELQSPAYQETLTGLGLTLGERFNETAPADLIGDLAREYTQLFIGPGPRISPHESIHVEIDGAQGGLWGKRTVEVKKFIESTGLEYDPSFSGLPDHISAELELMQKLGEREAEAWDQGDEKVATWFGNVQRRFYSEHLTAWVPAFCDKVIERAELPFYSEFAKVIQGFLEYEGEQLFDAEATDPAQSTA